MNVNSKNSDFSFEINLNTILVFLILLNSTLFLILPVPHSENIASLYPWWVQKVSFGKLLLHELLFIIWVIFFGHSYLLNALLNKSIPAHQSARWLIALAVWCGMMSLTAPLFIQDLGRTLRLLINVMFLFAIIRWSNKMGNLPLIGLVSGIVIGTLINLKMSFDYPLIINNNMRLSGQNTPGVAMAIGIHLSAWLFLRSKRFSVQLLAITTALICLFGAGLSYSRTGWGVALTGSMAWFYILFFAKARFPMEARQFKKLKYRWLPALIVFFITLGLNPWVQDIAGNIKNLISEKLITSEPRSGDSHRFAYLIGTAEIVADHPLGVGYSGFYDAMIKTRVYQRGGASEEVSLDANPHSTFLYYASAGGIPGTIMVLAVFIMLLHSMRIGLKREFSRIGVVFFWLIASSFLLIGLIVPYLLNSLILIAPTAIAASWIHPIKPMNRTYD